MDVRRFLPFCQKWSAKSGDARDFISHFTLLRGALLHPSNLVCPNLAKPYCLYRASGRDWHLLSALWRADVEEQKQNPQEDAQPMTAHSCLCLLQDTGGCCQRGRDSGCSKQLADMILALDISIRHTGLSHRSVSREDSNQYLPYLTRNTNAEAQAHIVWCDQFGNTDRTWAVTSTHHAIP